MPPRTPLSSCPGRSNAAVVPPCPYPGHPARSPQRAVGRWTREVPGTPAAGRSGRWSVLIAHHLLSFPLVFVPSRESFSALHFSHSTLGVGCQGHCQVSCSRSPQDAIGPPNVRGPDFLRPGWPNRRGHSVPRFRSCRPYRGRCCRAKLRRAGHRRRHRAAPAGVPPSCPRFLSAGALPARSRLRRRYGAWLSSGYLPYLLRSGRGGVSTGSSTIAPLSRGWRGTDRRNLGRDRCGQPVPWTSSLLSSWKASWSARTASATRSFLMMQVSRISLVEIISILMPCS